MQSRQPLRQSVWSGHSVVRCFFGMPRCIPTLQRSPRCASHLVHRASLLVLRLMHRRRARRSAPPRGLPAPLRRARRSHTEKLRLLLRRRGSRPPRCQCARSEPCSRTPTGDQRGVIQKLSVCTVLLSLSCACCSAASAVFPPPPAAELANAMKPHEQ